MKIPRLYLFVSLVSLFGMAGTGVVDAQQEPLIAGREAVSAASLKTDPFLVEGRLENGLTYFIRPNAEPKGRLSIRLRVETGSLNEVEENQGISHFIEHLVFNGSKHFKRGEVMPAMQRHGLGLGGDANAYTSFDETVYMLDLPNLEEKTTDLAFIIMRDFADGALLEESAINAERGIIESEYKARDSAQYRIMKDSFGFLLKGTKVPDRFPIGTLDFIRNGKRDLFLDYYKTQYVPSRMQVVLVGDITVEQGKALVEKYFGDMKPSDYTFKADWGKINEPEAQAARWLSNKELSSTSIMMTNVRPFVEKKDTEAKRLEDFPLEVAMGMLNKRFSRMTEKENCPFLNASIGLEEMFRSAELVALSVTTTEQKWREAMAGAEQEVRRAVEYGFTAAELNEIERSMLNAAEVSKKTWPTVKSNELAGGILSSVSAKEVFTDPAEDMRVLKMGLEMLKKDPKLCQQALKKAWDASKAQTVVTSNVENEKGAEEILACMDASSKVKVEPMKEEELKPFAYDKIGEPGKVADMTEIKDMQITQIKLSNGVRVNLKPTEFNKDLIGIHFEIDGGEITSPLDKPGLNMFATAVMNGGGLEAHSEEELSRILAGHTVGTSFAVTPQRFIVSGSTTKADFELQMKLMTAQMMYPGYRPEGAMKFRRVLPLLYTQLDHDPSGALRTQGMKYLLDDNKRLVFPAQSAFESLTIDDVKSWLGERLKKGYLEVSLVGDFDKEEVLPVLERTIGALPARPEKPVSVDFKALAVTLAKSGSTKDIDYPSSIDRTLVCSIWKTGDGFDRVRARKIVLLQAILRERLFKGIREKMGEAYSPSVVPEMSRTYPGLGYLMGVCPGVLSNRDAVAKAVDEIAAELAKGTIDQDELDRAKKPLLNAFDRDLRNNGYWMGVIDNSQADPEDIEMARTRIDALKAMTLDEMNDLAREIFKASNMVRINILPEIETAGKKEDAAARDGAKKAA